MIRTVRHSEYDHKNGCAYCGEGPELETEDIFRYKQGFSDGEMTAYSYVEKKIHDLLVGPKPTPTYEALVWDSALSELLNDVRRKMTGG